jgi:hypothetical protein
VKDEVALGVFAGGVVVEAMSWENTSLGRGALCEVAAAGCGGKNVELRGDTAAIAPWFTSRRARTAWSDTGISAW